MSAAIHRLSTSNLHALAASLRSGPLSLGLSRRSVAQIAGSATDEIIAYLQRLSEAGMSSNQTALLIDAIADTRNVSTEPREVIDLILSGPELPGVPLSDTIATVRTLVSEASRELILVGYAVHNAKPIFELIASRLAAPIALRVVFCLDLPRRHGDTSIESEIVRRFAREFHEKHWPWPNLPELYYDPRSLSEDPLQRSSLHAKCVIADRRKAIITSANFTQAAWLRNIELGVLVKYEPLVARLADYIDGLIKLGLLSKCAL
jgi:phosphatidylserine/phosphatidylglycerophosphate/cardiolipin synthase-like enzyme